jgi:AcrR family transcriptional regulator
MSKKTLYANFKSKDGLLDAVVEWHMISLKGKIEETLGAPTDFMERFYNFCSLVSGALSRIGIPLREDLRTKRPDLWKRVEEYRKVNIFGYFSRFLEEGMRLGVIRGTVNKEIVVLVLFSSAQGIINPETLSRHSFTARDAFQGIMNTVFEGILSETALPHYRRRFSRGKRKARAR